MRECFGLFWPGEIGRSGRCLSIVAWPGIIFPSALNLCKETCNALQFGEIESISPNCKTLQVALDKFNADGKMLTDCSAHSFT